MAWKEVGAPRGNNRVGINRVYFIVELGEPLFGFKAAWYHSTSRDYVD